MFSTCDLYLITTNQAAVLTLFRVVNRDVGNLQPMPLAAATIALDFGEPRPDHLSLFAGRTWRSPHVDATSTDWNVLMTIVVVLGLFKAAGLKRLEDLIPTKTDDPDRLRQE